MPLCSFAENQMMLGITPVENLFIQEYMPHASGDYVRVYLYGLMQCYYPTADMTIERTARILDLSEDTVLSAFQYWERQGIIQRVSDKPVSYRYLNIASMMGEESEMDRAIYRHRDFNSRLQKIFGNRLLQPGEYSMACEWLEELKLPESVVLMLVKYYVNKFGAKCQFKSINKLALKWAEEGILTEAQAEERLLNESDTWKLCEQVLRRLSLRRNPTKDELALAKKWLEEWKLLPSAVLAACAETINGRNPSMGYLDGILKRNVNASTGAEMTEQLQDQRKIDDAIKKLHEILGMRNVSPMTEEQQNYRNYIEVGFEPEAIIRVARDLAIMRPDADMQMLHKQLESFMTRNMLTLKEVEPYLNRHKTLRDQMAQVFAACGLERRVTMADANQMEEWLKNYELPLILYAAECAHGKLMQLQYITKLLDNWRKQEITTVEAARAQHNSNRNAYAQGTAFTAHMPTALNYQQRTYQEGELDYLFDRMNKYDTEEDVHDAQ